MRGRKAFTLVELLVVIAIIAILIAILLPVCIKVRNRALVLVCPIAYQGQDGGIYLTDPRGGHSLRVSEPGISCSTVYGDHGPLSWSPSGSRLGYTAYNRLTDRDSTYIHEPSTGKSWNFYDVVFSGWLNDDYFLGSFRSIHRVEAGPGMDLKFDPEARFEIISPTSIGADHPYVAGILIKNDEDQHIAWVGKNLQVRRIILSFPSPRHGVPWVAAWARVDPFNEYVAAGLWGQGTYVKRIKGPDRWKFDSAIPGELGDWTEDGRLLVCDEIGLVIYNKDGKLSRRLAPPIAAMGWSSSAYRKYGHQ